MVRPTAQAVAAQLRDCLSGYRGTSESVTIHAAFYANGFTTRSVSLDKWRAVRDYKFEFST